MLFLTKHIVTPMPRRKIEEDGTDALTQYLGLLRDFEKIDVESYLTQLVTGFFTYSPHRMLLE